MLRGEVHWADLEPVHGVEADKVRPVVIVSNNGANAAAARTGGVVTVIPLTSNTAKIYEFQSIVTVGQRESKAQAEQVRSISVNRLRGLIGPVSAAELVAMDAALRRHLAL